MKKWFILLVLLLSSSVFALRISRDDTKYHFIQLPSKPLPKEVDGYEAKVILTYLAQNEQKIADYRAQCAADEAEYQKRYKAWEADKKRLVDIYNEQMKAYNELPTEKKILTDGGTEGSAKPQLVIPAHPVRKPKLNPPLLLKEHNVALLKSTYGKLAGYAESGSNKANIEIHLHGLELIGPELVKQEHTKTYKDGRKHKFYTYRYKLQYRHPVSVKVLHTGSVIGEEMPAGAKKYQNKTSNAYDTEHELKKWWKNNKESYLNKLDEQLLEQNLKMLNRVMDYTFGYPKVRRETVVRVPSDKRHEYPEYVEAYSFAVAGYNALSDDVERKESKEKLKKAITIWEKALTEAKPNEKSIKKARINTEVTIATYLNLVEASIFIHDYDKADRLLVKMGTLDLQNKDERKMKRLRTFLKDQKERYKAKL